MAATSAVTASNTPSWLENSNGKPATKTVEDPLTSKDTFLKLLVAQLRNQDPMSPQDGVQFLSQLAQFSDLEQTMQMRQELTSIREAIDEKIKAENNLTPDTKTDTVKG